MKQEAKMVYLLECLQKTPPPVIVFSDNKNEVDGEFASSSPSLPPLAELTRRLFPSHRHPRVSPSQGSPSCRYSRIEEYVIPLCFAISVRFEFELSRVLTLFPSVFLLTTAQEEREYAIKAFKSGAKDVMVASGVASKGLDFNEIQHVIVRPHLSPLSPFTSLLLLLRNANASSLFRRSFQNYTMPKEIEDYVHQIGRTGRSGKTGIATTFVNMNTQEQTLLDLKYLLMEAKQRYEFSHSSRSRAFPERVR